MLFFVWLFFLLSFTVDEEFESVATQVLKRTHAMVNKYRRLLMVEAEVGANLTNSQMFLWMIISCVRTVNKMAPPLSLQRACPSSEMVMIDRTFNQEERTNLTQDKRMVLVDPGEEDACARTKCGLVILVCFLPFHSNSHLIIPFCPSVVRWLLGGLLLWEAGERRLGTSPPSVSALPPIGDGRGGTPPSPLTGQTGQPGYGDPWGGEWRCGWAPSSAAAPGEQERGGHEKDPAAAAAAAAAAAGSSSNNNKTASTPPVHYPHGNPSSAMAGVTPAGPTQPTKPTHYPQSPSPPDTDSVLEAAVQQHSGMLSLTCFHRSHRAPPLPQVSLQCGFVLSHFIVPFSGR